MTRIDQSFQKLHQAGKSAFMPFLTAGDPDSDTTVELIKVLERAGADLIELGVPYSDPLADGPVIQDSFTRALDHGFHVRDALDIVRRARASGVSIPILTMVSYSLVYRYGSRRYTEEAVQAGVDGLIVPDLTVEESDELAGLCRSSGLDMVLLVTPTTDPERRRRIIGRATGFLYCVSVVGITGERKTLPETLAEQVRVLKAESPIPVCVGFGVSQPEQARQVAVVADGVIVGSALVRVIAQSSGQDRLANVERLAEELAAAVHGVGGGTAK